MWSSAIVASLHYLALASGLPAVMLRGRALKGPFDDAGFHRLFTADTMWASRRRCGSCVRDDARPRVEVPA